jgi:hypothetical protein
MINIYRLKSDNLDVFSVVEQLRFVELLLGLDTVLDAVAKADPRLHVCWNIPCLSLFCIHHSPQFSNMVF